MQSFRAALFALAVVSLVSTACALTPGPTIIRECPACTNGLRQFTIGSGNMIGAKWWTDGKVEAPMLPMRPELGKCPHCQKLFWIEDAKKLAELSWTENGAKWDKAKEILLPVEEDYLQAADATGLSNKRQWHARQRAWWLANDPVRGRPGQSITWNNARRENLKKLSALFDEKSEVDVIHKAEIARELGQFEAGAKLLARTFKEKDCECESYARHRCASPQWGEDRWMESNLQKDVYTGQHENSHRTPDPRGRFTLRPGGGHHRHLEGRLRDPARLAEIHLQLQAGRRERPRPASGCTSPRQNWRTSGGC